MGGGFGGCTTNLVKRDCIDLLVGQIAPEYEKEMGRKLSVCVAEMEEGARVVFDGRQVFLPAK